MRGTELDCVRFVLHTVRIRNERKDTEMIKRLIAVVTVLVLALALVGCQSAAPETKKDPAEVVASINKEFLEKHADQLPAFMELDAETLQGMYGIEPEWVTAFVCQFPMMNVHATEIFIAHVADGQMDNVKQAIEARKEALDATWSMYLPEQHELVKNSVTEVSGNYILFAVTEHADSIKEIFAGATK